MTAQARALDGALELVRAHRGTPCEAWARMYLAVQVHLARCAAVAPPITLNAARDQRGGTP